MEKSADLQREKKLLTFPHEAALAVVHYVVRDESVVDHVVIFHAAEAAVLDTVVDFLLQQGML